MFMMSGFFSCVQVKEWNFLKQKGFIPQYKPVTSQLPQILATLSHTRLHAVNVRVSNVFSFSLLHFYSTAVIYSSV